MHPDRLVLHQQLLIDQSGQFLHFCLRVVLPCGFEALHDVLRELVELRRLKGRQILLNSRVSLVGLANPDEVSLFVGQLRFSACLIGTHIFLRVGSLVQV